MKKSLAIILALMMVLSITGMSFAETVPVPGVDTPGVAGVFIDQITDHILLTPAALEDLQENGWIVPLGGYVGYMSSLTGGGNPNHPLLYELVVTGQVWDGTSWVDDKTVIEWSVTGGNRLGSVYLGSRSVPGRDFIENTFNKLDWKTYKTGKYRVIANATLSRQAGGSSYNPEAEPVDFEVYTEIVISDPFVIEPMAAPAVASHILQYNEVKPLLVTGSGKNRTQVNMIAAVAQQMGPKTDFDCGDGNLVPKSIWVGEPAVEVTNPDYWDAVLCFLNDQFGLGLDMPDEDYFEGLME